MTHTYQITGMTCSGCAATIEKALKKVPGVVNVAADVDSASAKVDAERHVAVTELIAALVPYPHYHIHDGPAAASTIAIPVPPAGFWTDVNVWQRASLNTLNCLIGCSIGDFGMILFLQKYYPQASMSVQMVLAVIAGLATSVMLETILLRVREKFNWKLALQTAISMSFLSMVGMEVAMNFTDFMLTGGKAAFGNPMYWTALGVASVAGFIAPLPYNYYKLKNIQPGLPLSRRIFNSMAAIDNKFKALYKNFNERNIDAVIAQMTEDVKWANGMEGGFVYSHAGVRDYWTRQFAVISSQVTPVEITETNSVVRIKVHQVAHDLRGKLLVDEFVTHLFKLKDGKISQFEIEK